MNLDKEKQLAAKEAVKYVKSGMTVGLGTGSTAAHMVRELGLLVENGLKIVGVPSSENTNKLTTELGIPLTTLDKTNGIDIYIDGADEFDPYMQLIKGGGGALLREKILTYNSDLVIIIADSQKEVKRLGNFKLPVETIPLATIKIANKLQEMGLLPKLRIKDGKNFVTDEGNYILDLDIKHISNIPLLESRLKQIPGIVETGLFLDMADIIIIGKDETTVTLKK
ncbi:MULTISPECIES: ribose-5-phosphate isomerase RpiA [unclassified Arenibacter]|uniref:ribose-5-phosphate isomerase RpiA n=1 Tax=unclassified Arenibacter TaxID=2615047 RepID=UPI000E34B46B|nr:MULTISPECIES: ribose-5-phosphate isomerase RpiA [unclassified Arenibacter]MCM4165733.1 ribose 5-phosphate isomerase A [Arenibacter sp. A80]RFT54582.1 ribose-5-phosphate isomerase RpiA [Arenibacter sp. P308M17]